MASAQSLHGLCTASLQPLNSLDSMVATFATCLPFHALSCSAIFEISLPSSVIYLYHHSVKTSRMSQWVHMQRVGKASTAPGKSIGVLRDAMWDHRLYFVRHSLIRAVTRELILNLVC